MRVVIGWAFVKRLLRLNVRKPTGGSRSRAEAVPRRGQRHRPLSANTFWVGRRADGNAGPTQRLALHPANGRNGASTSLPRIRAKVRSSFALQTSANATAFDLRLRLAPTEYSADLALA